MKVAVPVSPEVQAENDGRSIGVLTIGTVLGSPPPELAFVALLEDMLRVKELLRERLPEAVVPAAIPFWMAFAMPRMVSLLETEL